jgi:hypothetical protein
MMPPIRSDCSKPNYVFDHTCGKGFLQVWLDETSLLFFNYAISVRALEVAGKAV